MSSNILERIRQADNLPSLPAVAMQVLKMTQADDCSVAEIARVIQQDPALTGRLLKIVNSSLFGLSRKISSLPQATVVLGLRTLKVMVLSFSLVDTMQKRRTGGFDFAGYWRRSLTTAVASRLLAERVRRPLIDEAFVCGLLCDIGMLAASQCAKEIYSNVIEKYDSGKETLQSVELAMLGITHETIGMELLAHWGLPEAVCRAVQTHHSPVSAPAGDDENEVALTRILRASALVSDLFCAETGIAGLGDVQREIATHLPIEEATLVEALETLDVHVKETASLFSINIGPTRGYEEIQTEACVQLARLSMAAELERAQTAQREAAARKQVEVLNDENAKLAQQVATDGLTGIASRAALDQHLRAACRDAGQSGQRVGLLLLDLDHFKKLNDTFGHQAGDEALRQVGGYLQKIGDQTRFAARYGGEEFAILVANATAKQLRELGEEVRATIQKLRISAGPKVISITASIGGACLQTHGADLEPKRLVEQADRCLYDAKHAGRNRVVLQDKE
jgi:two-component system cell cycle response regulator